MGKYLGCNMYEEETKAIAGNIGTTYRVVRGTADNMDDLSIDGGKYVKSTAELGGECKNEIVFTFPEQYWIRKIRFKEHPGFDFSSSLMEFRTQLDSPQFSMYRELTRIIPSFTNGFYDYELSHPFVTHDLKIYFYQENASCDIRTNLEVYMHKFDTKYTWAYSLTGMGGQITSPYGPHPDRNDASLESTSLWESDQTDPTAEWDQQGVTTCTEKHLVYEMPESHWVTHITFMLRGDDYHGGLGHNDRFSIEYQDGDTSPWTQYYPNPSDTSYKDMSTMLATQKDQYTYRATTYFNPPFSATKVRMTIEKKNYDTEVRSTCCANVITRYCLIMGKFDIAVIKKSETFTIDTPLQGCMDPQQIYLKNIDTMKENKFEISPTAPTDLVAQTPVAESTYLAFGDTVVPVTIEGEQIISSPASTSTSLTAYKLSYLDHLIDRWDLSDEIDQYKTPVQDLHFNYQTQLCSVDKDNCASQLTISEGAELFLEKGGGGIYFKGSDLAYNSLRVKITSLRDNTFTLEKNYIVDLCEVDLNNYQLDVDLEQSLGKNYTLDIHQLIMQQKNPGKTCPTPDDTDVGQVTLQNIMKGGVPATSDQFTGIGTPTFVLQLDQPEIYNLELRYQFYRSKDTSIAITDLPTYSMTLFAIVCQVLFPTLNLQGSYSVSTQKLTFSTLTAQFTTNHKCDPSAIILASDTEGTPTTAEGILSITSDDYLEVNFEKVPIFGDRQYTWYLFGLNKQANTRYAQVIFNATGCETGVEPFLQATVSGQPFKELVEKPTGVTQRIAALDIVSGRTYNTDPLCQLVLNQAQILRLENYEGESYSSKTLYVENNSIVLKKDAPLNAKLNAIYYFEALGKEFKRPFEATICGFETLQVQGGITKFEVKLAEDDKMVKVPVSRTKSTSLIKSSSTECTIKSYRLARNVKGDPLDYLTGVGFLSLEDNLLMFNRANALSGTFSAYLMAETLGGVTDTYQFQFKITKSLNIAPNFVGEMADIILAVDQKNQVEGSSTVVTIESPKIEDPEGNFISIDISGAESIHGVKITKNIDSFTVVIDESQITATSSNTVTITLDDDGPSPKFANIVTFKIEIEYTKMPAEELEEILEEQAFEQSLEESSSISILVVPGESVVKRKQRLKRLKLQTERIGTTFPGVTNDQMANIDKDEKIQDPSMAISSMNSSGFFTISFNQPMFFPEDISIFDYSKVMKFSLIHAQNGKRVQASFSNTKRFRNLEMTIQEKMEYFSTIPYDASHVLEEDLFNKRSPKKGQQTSNSAGQKSETQQSSFSWEVESHNATDLAIQLSFSSPGEISSTNSGRDTMIIDILDTSLFKSQKTLKSVDPVQFSKLQKDLPPIIEDEAVVESLQQSTDMIGKITTFLSSANFAVGLVLGGSMQQLYGLIRAMQMIILTFLSDVQYPAHTYIFFQGALLFAQMDIFSGEDHYENWFEFQPTQPINERFDEFGMSDKNFIMQSGSFLIMQTGIIVWHILQWMIFKLSIKFAKNKYARKLGMYVGKPEASAMKDASLRLFLESYFDISQAAFLGVYAFWESKNISLFFHTTDDILCSIMTILVFIATFWFPCWFLYKEKKDPNFIEKNAWFFEGMNKDVPLYQFYFMIRRLLVSILLIFFHAYPVLQISCFILFSVVNMIYLIQTEPFLKTKDLRVEIFNEGCILICLFETFTLLDPSMVTEDRNFTGWAIIYLVCINIAGNLFAVSWSVSGDLYISISEYYELMTLEELFIGTDGEVDDLKYCRDWFKEVIWLQENDIDYSQFEEQNKFENLVEKHQYRKRAETLNIIYAHQRVVERVRHTQVTQRVVEKIKKNAAKKIDLRTIQEISEGDLDSASDVDAPIVNLNAQQLDMQGMLAGPQTKFDINLFEKLGPQGFQPLKIDFIVDNSTEALEEQIYQKVVRTKQERWDKEFSVGLRVINLESTNYQIIANVLQCLVPLKSFIQEIVVKDHEDIKMKKLQKLYMIMLQKQLDNLEYESFSIDFFTSMIPRGLSGPHFFRYLFPATQEPFTGQYEIDGVLTPMQILMLPDFSSLDQAFSNFLNPIDSPCISPTILPQVLVFGISSHQPLDFPLTFLDHTLFGVVYKNAAVVNRDGWYRFGKEEVERVREGEVVGNKEGVQMLFYQKGEKEGKEESEEEEEEEEEEDSY